MKLCGTVIRGRGRGASLGFPTANLRLDTNYNLPDSGVYAGFAHIAKNQYLAAIHIGPKPTFAEDDSTIEAHVLDFSENLYGKKVCLTIRHKLRNVEKFDTLKALRDAIKDDCKRTRELLDT